MRAPELVAHRGWPRRHPENTLPGIEAALQAGAVHVEVDVQLSADRVPVLFHDADLARLCGAAGAVADHPLAALAALRFKDAGDEAEIPTLTALASLLGDRPRVTPFVEIKPEAMAAFGVEETYWRVAAALAPLAGRAVLISFDLAFLLAARRHGWPALGAVVERWAERTHPLLAEIAPEYLFTDVDFLPADGPLEWCGARLAVYEVADPDLALDLARRGVDLVETFDFGAMLAALRRRREAGSHA
jgi:glycerophosphoryl diester phosphodiesterase